jgi:hypothetical protein
VFAPLQLLRQAPAQQKGDLAVIMDVPSLPAGGGIVGQAGGDFIRARPPPSGRYLQAAAAASDRARHEAILQGGAALPNTTGHEPSAPFGMCRTPEGHIRPIPDRVQALIR